MILVDVLISKVPDLDPDRGGQKVLDPLDPDP